MRPHEVEKCARPSARSRVAPPPPSSRAQVLLWHAMPSSSSSAYSFKPGGSLKFKGGDTPSSSKK